MPSGETPPPEQRSPVRILRTLNIVYARIYHDLTICSPLRIPARGPAIMVCNHISGLDPVLIQSVCNRRLIWMMAREYYEIRSLRWFFRQVEAIPVDRSGRDMMATRAALRALHEGQVLGVFPEGRLETGTDLLPFQTGVALMAIKAHVPIYPGYIEGTQRGLEMLPAYLRRQRATLAFGPPLRLQRPSTDRPDLEAATGQIVAAILRLRQTVWALQPPRRAPRTTDLLKRN